MLPVLTSLPSFSPPFRPHGPSLLSSRDLAFLPPGHFLLPHFLTPRSHLHETPSYHLSFLSPLTFDTPVTPSFTPGRLVRLLIRLPSGLSFVLPATRLSDAPVSSWVVHKSRCFFSSFSLHQSQCSDKLTAFFHFFIYSLSFTISMH